MDEKILTKILLAFEEINNKFKLLDSLTLKIVNKLDVSYPAWYYAYTVYPLRKPTIYLNAHALTKKVNVRKIAFHEYGHIIQAYFVQKEYENNGWKKSNYKEFVIGGKDDSWYLDKQLIVFKRLYNEVMSLIPNEYWEEVNSTLRMLHDYEMSDVEFYREFFAVAFENFYKDYGYKNKAINTWCKALHKWVKLNVKKII